MDDTCQQVNWVTAYDEGFDEGQRFPSGAERPKMTNVTPVIETQGRLTGRRSSGV